MTAAAAKKIFARCADFVTRDIAPGLDASPPVTLCWLDGLVSGSDLAETLLRPLTEFWRAVPGAAALRDRLLAGGVSAWSVQRCGDLSALSDALTHGSCALILDELGEALCFELRSAARAIGEPTLEKSLKGGRDAFVETLRVNTSLLRRRLATPSLKLIESSVGRRSATKISIIYIEGICDMALVRELARRLDRLDTDALLSLSPLESALCEAPRSPFPQLIHTQRPDRLATLLSEGRVGLLVDGIPIALALPAALPDFLSVAADGEQHPLVTRSLRLLRTLALLLALLLPGLYVAMVRFHQEMIPTRLLLSMIAARQEVPFATWLELGGMMISFLLLQEAGLRLPGPMGDTVSIIGALIVGQAAVDARLVSPVAIIVVAAAGIACYALPSQDLAAAVRLWSFFLLLLGAMGGLFGVGLGCCLLLWQLCGIESFARSYTEPFRRRPRIRDALIRIRKERVQK